MADTPTSTTTPRGTASTFVSFCGEVYALQVQGQTFRRLGSCAGTLSVHSSPRIHLREGQTFALVPVGGRWGTYLGVPTSDAPNVVSLKAPPSAKEPATYVARRAGTATLSTITTFCTDGPVHPAPVGGSTAVRECPVVEVLVTP